MKYIAIALLAASAVAGCSAGFAERFHRGMTADPYPIGKKKTVETRHCTVMNDTVVCH